MPFHTIISDGEGWETVKREPKYADPYTELVVEHVKTPSRTDPQQWTVVHRKAAAVVAPITVEGKFILIHQERIPIRDGLWEFPAGQIDDQQNVNPQTIRETALRELQEESGYELGPDGELVEMGHFFTSQGFTDEHGYLFVAHGVVPAEGGHEHDDAESIVECSEFSAAELQQMIAENIIRDANTLTTYARMCALGIIVPEWD